MKNNITRLLDQKKIDYTVFELTPEKIGAKATAKRLGVPQEVVFKTIVVKRMVTGKTILAVVPGDSQVDLKLLARAVSEKKVKMTTQSEAEKLTGLVAGGISPLALINRGFQVVIDSSVESQAMIYVSGGQWGMNIELAPSLLEMAGLPAPGRMEGESFVPLLKSRSAPGRRAWLYEYFRDFPFRIPTTRAVRTEKHMYIEFEGRKGRELYDVKNDPRQLRNMIDTEEGKRLARELGEMLAALKE